MSKVGKKSLIDSEVDAIFRKLEPYLKKGLSLHKACLEAQIPSSRTGAIDLEPFGYAQGKLLPLLDSIIINWKIGTFEQRILMKNNEDCPQNYVF